MKKQKMKVKQKHKIYVRNKIEFNNGR